MKYRAGFDVGGTNARVHLFDEDLTALGGTRRRIRDESGTDEVANTLVELLIETCAETGVDIAHIDAIGLGIAGQLSTDGRTVRNAPNLGWRDIDFVTVFEAALTEQTDLDAAPTIRLVNDLNAQLWGESRGGAVRDRGDVLAVYVGTGIGGAILSNGRLTTGNDANAGEIGHSKVVIGGRLCGCGERGCVEAYAGGVHLERQVAAAVHGTDDPERAKLLTEDGAHLGHADDLAYMDHDIGDIWEEATDYLAIVVANACTLLNPASLLIGGGVLENCPTFRAMLLQKCIPLILEVARENLTVEEASLGDIAGMLGAADLAGNGELSK